MCVGSLPRPHIQRLTLSFPGLPLSSSNALPLDTDSDEVALAATEPLSGSRMTSSAARGVWAGTPEAAEALRVVLSALPRYGGVGLSVAPALPMPSTGSSLFVAYDFTFSADALIAFGGDPPLLSCVGTITAGGLMGGCTSAGCLPRLRQLRALQLPQFCPDTISLDPRAVLKQPDAAPDGSAAPADGWGVATSLLLTRIAPARLAFQWVDTLVYGQPIVFGGAAAPLPPGILRSALSGPFGLLLQLSEQDDAQLMDDLFAAGAGDQQGPWRLDFAWRLPACSVTVLQTHLPVIEATECSDKGVCSRDSGKCQCFPGWEGVNCDTAAISDSNI